MIRRKACAGLPAALAALLAGAAAAQGGNTATATSPPPDPWSFTLGLTTDYVRNGTLRGQDDIEAAATAQWSPRGDFYAGAAANTAAVGDSDYELNLAAGLQPQWVGWSWNLAVTRVLYFGGSGDVDNWQGSAQASRTFGPATWTFLAGGSPDYEGPGGEAVWGQATLAWALTKRLGLETALGAQDQDGGPDYVWWQAGITWSVTSALSLDLHWYDTDNAAALGTSGDGQAVAALAWSF
jgi:uncharacterized protein (TIGR02001 family)